MLDIKDIYEKVVLTESKSKHIYENGDMTFADIRDIITDVFKNGGTVMQKRVPGMKVLVTFKDGEFCIATDDNDLSKPCCCSKITDSCCKAGKEVKAAFLNTIADLVEALQQLDPILLNKYFANGQNFIDCQVVFPPEDYCGSYGNKCFMTFNKLRCFDSDFKELGEDTESSEALFSALRSSETMKQEVAEIADPSIKLLQSCISGKVILDKALAKLKQFIDGVGWGCSVNSYIQDKCSRYIINKALEHGLDVSRNSAFVNELVSRLSGSKIRPTKSDLVCFAKREGINCNSDAYKSFLSDIESNEDDTCQKIIAPIESLVCYVVQMVMRNLVGYLATDPSEKTKKFISQIDQDCYSFDVDDAGECIWNRDKLESLRKNLARVCQYASTLPSDGIVIMYKKTPYRAVSKLGKLDSLCKMIGC